MTDRAEIERLLNQTGRTLEGLPTQYDYLYDGRFAERDEKVGEMMWGARFTLDAPYIMHQSDVIELLVGALADKLRTRKVMSGEKVAQDAYETAMWDALNEPVVTLNELRDEVYQDAVAHGLWEDAEAIKNVPDLHDACIDLIAAEVCEMGEAWMDKEKFSEELADVIIMSLSVAGKLGIDIDGAVKRKMEINKGRPWKHGKETK